MELKILGYCSNRKLISKAELVSSENSIVLFLGYASDDIPEDGIPEGTKFTEVEDYNGEIIPVDLELAKVHLGFVKWHSIPRGYKSVVQLNGTKKEIKLLKKKLERMLTWKIPKNGVSKLR